jgi:hypothetical protein
MKQDEVGTPHSMQSSPIPSIRAWFGLAVMGSHSAIPFSEPMRTTWMVKIIIKENLEEIIKVLR